jgi:Zn-dependent protease
MGFDADLLATLPLWFVAFLFSTTCHEAAHALVAKLGGDLTAFHEGQVSLDPIRHIRREPIGMVVVPILSFFLNGGAWMIGWASAPYDPYWARRHPRRAGLMALAGPVANFLLVLVSAGIIHAGIAAGWFMQPFRASFDSVVLTAGAGKSAVTMFLSVLFSLNLLLGTFNLLPVPPLDGAGVIQVAMTGDGARRWQDIANNRTAAMIGFVLVFFLFGRIFGPIFTAALHALYPGTGWG